MWKISHLTRYSGGIIISFWKPENEKSQLEATYERQQKEIADLKTRGAPAKPRVATRNNGNVRQKKLDKMDIIGLQWKSPSQL